MERAAARVRRICGDQLKGKLQNYWRVSRCSRFGRSTVPLRITTCPVCAVCAKAAPICPNPVLSPTEIGPQRLHSASITNRTFSSERLREVEGICVAIFFVTGSRVAPCVLAQPDQQKEVQSQPAGFHKQVPRQQSTSHDIVPVMSIVNEQMAIARPFLYARPVLQVIYICIGLLPLLQWSGAAEQTEFDGRDDELKALQFNALTEPRAKIKTDTGAERPSQCEHHSGAGSVVLWI